MPREEGLEGRFVPVTSVLDMMQCSICLEVVKIPFKQCKTGHLACSGCIDRVVGGACPLCKETVFQENPICIKNILESLPRRCQHSANGCTLVVGPGDDHVTYCGYRSVNCKYPNCRETAPLCNLKEHYEKKHESCFLFCSPKSEIIYYDMVRSAQNIILYNVPMPTLGHFFWIEGVLNKEFFELTFHVHPNGQLAEDFFIRLELNKGHQGITFILKANIDGKKDKESCTMKLPNTTTDLFISDEKHLKIDYEIFSKPKSSPTTSTALGQAPTENRCLPT